MAQLIIRVALELLLVLAGIDTPLEAELITEIIEVQLMEMI